MGKSLNEAELQSASGGAVNKIKGVSNEFGDSYKTDQNIYEMTHKIKVDGKDVTFSGYFDQAHADDIDNAARRSGAGTRSSKKNAWT